jgi:hypothetical protein
MAITTGQLALTTSPALVVTPDVDGCRVMLYVVGNNAVYLGASNVTSSTGLELRKDHGITELRLRPGDNLYAVAATTETLTYMIVENN